MNRLYLLNLFDVDIETGRLYWRAPSKYHREKAGMEAGNEQPSRNNKIYWVVSINGRKYRRGRLIFCILHDRFPEPCLDHINGNSLDDRPCNLREATITENAWNHKTRRRRIPLPMGVRLIPHSGRFEARISHHGKQFHLGAFDTPEEAAAVYQLKRKVLYGDFA